MALYNSMTAQSVKSSFTEVANELDRLVKSWEHLKATFDMMPAVDVQGLGIDADTYAQMNSAAGELAALAAWASDPAHSTFIKRFATLRPF